MARTTRTTVTTRKTTARAPVVTPPEGGPHHPRLRAEGVRGRRPGRLRRPPVGRRRLRRPREAGGGARGAQPQDGAREGREGPRRRLRPRRGGPDEDRRGGFPPREGVRASRLQGDLQARRADGARRPRAVAPGRPAAGERRQAASLARARGPVGNAARPGTQAIRREGQVAVAAEGACRGEAAHRARPRRGRPFGAIYEIGALMALQESLEGVDFNDLDVYVGVSAGSFLAAALANGIPVSEIYGIFIEGDEGEGALTPEVFMRPAFREYLRAGAERAADPRPLALAVRAAAAFAAGRSSRSRPWAAPFRPASSTTTPSTSTCRPSSPSPGAPTTSASSGAEPLPRRHRPGQRRERELRPAGPRRRADLAGRAGERRASGALPAGRDRRALLRRRRAQEDAARVRGPGRRGEARDLREPDRPLRRGPRRREGQGAPPPARRRGAPGGAVADLPRHHPLADGGGDLEIPQRSTGTRTWSSSSRTPTTARSSSPTSSATRPGPASASTPTQRTRRDLLRRRHELEPVLARHGCACASTSSRIRTRRLGLRRGIARARPAAWRLPDAAADLRETLVDLRRWLAAKDRAPA